MFCNKCGSENRNDRKFCANCGAPLRDYTKPRENLIMPEEIAEKQKVVKKRNLMRLVTNIIMTLFLTVAAGLAIASFYVKNNLVNFFATASAICLVVVIVTYIVKRKIMKNLNKALKPNEENNNTK